MLLDSITLALTGKISCPSTSSHTSPPSCDGDLEFSGVQIHWSLLVNQLRVQVHVTVLMAARQFAFAFLCVFY